jgi:hypothetical protein
LRFGAAMEGTHPDQAVVKFASTFLYKITFFSSYILPK